MAGLLDEQALAQLLAMGRAGDTIGGLLNFSRSPPRSGGLLGLPDAVAPKPFGLADTWPARLAQTLLEAAKLPGDVYTGKQPSYLGLRSNDYTDDPTAPDPNQHLTEGAGDLAGLMGLGAMPMAQRGAAGALGGKLVQPEGIRAYHGSPHDFDRFDISKIGTGEGAQSYGHGLYFAEAEPVARAYRDKLGGQTGRMYEVNIHAKPEQFLDWNKPLAQQSIGSTIQDVAQQIKPGWLPTLNNDLKEIRRGLASNPESTGATAYSMLGRGLGDQQHATAALREAGIPGIKYLDQGSRKAGGGTAVDDTIMRVLDAVGGNPQKAIAELENRIASAQKIPEQYRAVSSNLPDAIDLLKSGSWKDPRTSNYVLFDDKIIDILRKYGLAGLLGGGASAKVNAPGMLDN